MPWGSCPCPGVEMRGSPPLAPPLCVCGEIYLTLPYLTAAHAARLPIVMAHENDPSLDGCAFARQFETTPQELIAGGLYQDLAVACFAGIHREAAEM